MGEISTSYPNHTMILFFIQPVDAHREQAVTNTTFSSQRVNGRVAPHTRGVRRRYSRAHAVGGGDDACVMEDRHEMIWWYWREEEKEAGPPTSVTSHAPLSSNHVDKGFKARPEDVMGNLQQQDRTDAQIEHAYTHIDERRKEGKTGQAECQRSRRRVVASSPWKGLRSGGRTAAGQENSFWQRT